MQTKLFRRDFTLVVIGQIISLFGNAILRFALPLYLLRETGSSTLFGVVTACSFAPMVILSLIGGVLADRVNKRDIMVGLDFSTAAIIMLFYFSLGKIPTVPLFIVALMLLYGISGTYQPAVQASVSMPFRSTGQKWPRKARSTRLFHIRPIFSRGGFSAETAGEACTGNANNAMVPIASTA